MRILIHDYSGHPFQVQLSRHLAAWGHSVRHAYSAAVETPRGPLATAPDDPPTFDVVSLAVGRTLAKYRPLKRLRQETAYAEELAQQIRDLRPDVVLSGNCNPVIQHRAAGRSHRVGAGFVTWLQDLYAPALRDALGRRSRAAAGVLGALADRVERRALRASDMVVPVAPAFADAAVAAGQDPSRVRTIPNWAPPLEMPADGGTAWRARHGLTGCFIFLYAGTLGQKHDPERIADIARHMRADPDTAVVVASQGPGRAHLERVRAAEQLENLVLLDFLPYAELPGALAAADVLLAVLSVSGGGYAVPSKILTAMRAGRPVLAAMPSDNAASTTLSAAEAGIVVPPDDGDGWRYAAEWLRADPALRARLGGNGAGYAARQFDIDQIAENFLDVMVRARESVARRQVTV
jgi:glycosyltransferase involved in cell wall biosynthesis